MFLVSRRKAAVGESTSVFLQNQPFLSPFSTISAMFTQWLITLARPVGRVEFRIFLGLYALSLPFQLLTTGSLLEQGSTALTVLTAIHAGIVAALFWMLVGNALISFQLVDDGTMASVVVSPLAPCLFNRPS